MIENRMQELIDAMPSFGRETYYNSEVLDEMFALQQEMVRLTFPEDEELVPPLRLMNVLQHLEAINTQCDNAAGPELERFREETTKFCSLLKAEISGRKGERRVYKELTKRLPESQILRNVELGEEGRRTEIDFVVVTSRGVVIIENKNTISDVYIDEDGVMTKHGRVSTHKDGNIGKRITLRRQLLEETLEAHGIRNVPIKTVLVFTNDCIRVFCEYPVTTVYASQLNYNLYDYDEPEVLDEGTIDRVIGAIQESACNQMYPMKYNITQFKMDYAATMAILEAASAGDLEAVEAYRAANNMPFISGAAEAPAAGIAIPVDVLQAVGEAETARENAAAVDVARANATQSVMRDAAEITAASMISEAYEKRAAEMVRTAVRKTAQATGTDGTCGQLTGIRSNGTVAAQAVAQDTAQAVARSRAAVGATEATAGATAPKDEPRTVSIERTDTPKAKQDRPARYRRFRNAFQTDRVARAMWSTGIGVMIGATGAVLVMSMIRR